MIDQTQALRDIPGDLRKALLTAYEEIVRNFREARWEPSELNGGKLCEVVYSILKGLVSGRMPTTPSKPRNMVDACRSLEAADPIKFPRAVRIQIPRMIMALYEIRNNRGVGHVGGDVDPNQMDARIVLEMAKWLMAELVRLFHGLGTAEATMVVEGLVQRTVPVIWQVGEGRRVLRPDLPMKDQTLLLLYSVLGPVGEDEVQSWVDHPNRGVFRRDVLRPLHRARLVEYDQAKGQLEISPIGIDYVETNLPLQV